MRASECAGTTREITHIGDGCVSLVGAIEWRMVTAADGVDAAESSLNLLVQSAGHSQLLTYSADASVDSVLESLVTVVVPHSVRKHTACRVVSGEHHVAVDSSAALGALLTKHARPHGGQNDLKLACAKHIFPFIAFVAQPNQANEIRARNLLRRELTGEMAEYPLEAAELIGDDWTGILGWVAAFVKYHWGPMHAYPDYTTSTTQTGRFHLNTGRSTARRYIRSRE